MKYLLILSLVFAASAHAQTITPEQAKDNVGKTETVCGTVFSVHTGKSRTYINFGAAYPGQVFTVVVFNEDTTNFTYPLSTLSNKKVCVTGTVKTYQDKPEMDIDKADKIIIK